MYSSRESRGEEKLRLERRKKAEGGGLVVTSEVSLTTEGADGTATTVSASV